MKVKKAGIIAIIGLYAVCMYIWTLPVNEMPYGGGDATVHFAIGDYMAQTNRPIHEMPRFLSANYGHSNVYKNGLLWYPPALNMDFAVSSIIGNQRVVPSLIFVAFASSAVVFLTFFLFKPLFGFWVAILSSFLLVFSQRIILPLLWGQWPNLASMSLIPLIFLVFYKYIISFTEGKEKNMYLAIFIILLAGQFVIHPAGFIYSCSLLFFSLLAITIKQRKMVVNVKRMIIGIVLFLVIIFSLAPYQTLSIIKQISSGEGPAMSGGNYSEVSTSTFFSNIPDLFRWYPDTSEKYPGYPKVIFSYKESIGGTWTIPLLLLGVFALVHKRRIKDLLILGWLAGHYFAIHLDVFGFTTNYLPRFLYAEPYIFYPILSIGLVSISSFFKKGSRKYIKVGLVILFAILFMQGSGVKAHDNLKYAYGGLLRINPAQYSFAEWAEKNLPEDSVTVHYGSLNFPVSKYMWMLSYRLLAAPEAFTNVRAPWARNPSYYLFDYSGLTMIGDDKNIAMLEQQEKNITKGSKLVFNQKYVRVYEIG